LEHFRKLNTVPDVNEEEDDTFEHVDAGLAGSPLFL
jgi:hypothetical protein